MTGQDLIDFGMFEASYRNSRMLRVLKSDAEIEVTQSYHLYQVMKTGNEVIGLALIERISRTEHPLVLLKNPFSGRSAVEAISKKRFVCDGFFQVFVKPQYRGRGVATSLARKALTKYLSNRQFKEREIAMLVAKNGAKEVLRRTAIDVYVKDSPEDYSGIGSDIHFETVRCMEKIDIGLEKAARKMRIS